MESDLLLSIVQQLAISVANLEKNDHRFASEGNFSDAIRQMEDDREEVMQHLIASRQRLQSAQNYFCAQVSDSQLPL